MFVKELWRYPVKSLRGERVKEIKAGELGFVGDRLVHVQREDGRVVTARTHPKLLALKGSFDADGKVFVNGTEWDTPEALDLVQIAAGPDAKLVYSEGLERFDILPLLVATDGAIDYMKFDSRRLRPNVIIGGVEGLAERSMPGHHLKIGEVYIFAHRLRPRCVMTTWDPDTQAQDITVLKRIVTELEGVMALDCSISEPGVVREGDQVEWE